MKLWPEVGEVRKAAPEKSGRVRAATG